MRSIYYREENEVPIDDAWDSQSETLLHGWQNSFEFFFSFSVHFVHSTGLNFVICLEGNGLEIFIDLELD